MFGFATLNETTYTLDSFSTNKQTEIGNFIALQSTNYDAYYLLALGGKADSRNRQKYSNLVSNVANINTLVNSTVDFLLKYNFDGLSLDWLYPATSSDFDGYANLIVALKSAFLANGLILISSVSAVSSIINGILIQYIN